MQRLIEVSWGEVAIAAAVGAAVAAWAWPAAGAIAAPAYGVLGWALVLIALVDLRALRIPDQLSLPLIPLGLFTAWWMAPDQLANHAAAVLVGGGGLYALQLAYRRWRGFDGLGFGDVKLTAAAGAWVGLETLPHVLLLASLAGIVSAALFRRSVAKNLDAGRTRLPFGCYESFAVLAAVFWQFH
jgi:leader peptidase (prepilin peptidase) / N-methyltransferase